MQLCFVELSKYKRLLSENKVERDFWADLLLAENADELVELSERGGEIKGLLRAGLDTAKIIELTNASESEIVAIKESMK